MKKKLLFSLALAFILSVASLVGTPGTQKAEAADWTTTGSIFTTYYHSGSFSNYVYQRTFTTTTGDYLSAGVKASSSGSGTFKAILQKKTNGVWKNYKTKYPSKNGSTSLAFSGITKGATYRYKFENTGSSKVTYTFWVEQ